MVGYGGPKKEYMPKKSKVPVWTGLLNPVRLLTPDEVNELGELCAVCQMPAHVVEALTDLTEKEKKQTLDVLNLDQFRFTCGLHAPINVPQHTLNDIDLRFFQMMNQPLVCPDKRWTKYYVNCLRIKPTCLKRCDAVKGRLPTAISLDSACQMIARGYDLNEQYKQSTVKENNDADSE